MSEIEPDTKDWTWVLNDACPECGFEAASFPVDAVAGHLRTNGAAWVDVLARAGHAAMRSHLASA